MCILLYPLQLLYRLDSGLSLARIPGAQAESHVYVSNLTYTNDTVLLSNCRETQDLFETVSQQAATIGMCIGVHVGINPR